MEAEVHAVRSFFRDLYLEAFGVAHGRYRHPSEVQLLAGDVLYAARVMKLSFDGFSDTQRSGPVKDFFARSSDWTNATSILTKLIDLYCVAATDSVFEDRRLAHIAELAPALMSSAAGMPIATRVKLRLAIQKLQGSPWLTIRKLYFYAIETGSDLLLRAFGVSRKMVTVLRNTVHESESAVLMSLRHGSSSDELSNIITTAIQECRKTVVPKNWIRKVVLQKAFSELKTVQQSVPKLVEHVHSVGLFVDKLVSADHDHTLSDQFRRFDVTTQCYIIKKIFPVIHEASSYVDNFRVFFREMLRNERRQRLDLIVTALLNNNWGIKGLPLGEVCRYLAPSRSIK
jgi:hypothetical protein